MSNLDPALVIQYQSQFETALQQKGSKLRDHVHVQDVVGESTRFDIVGTANVVIDRDIAQPLAFDTDQPITNALAEMKRFESWRTINKLQEFMAKANARQPFADSTAMALGRQMDKSILDAMKASNTSAGAAAAMDIDLLSTITELTETYDWNTSDMTLVITPRVYNKLMKITQYGSADFNSAKPLVDGKAKSFMGWNIVVSSILQSSTYWTSSTSHNCYAFHNGSVGLGIAKDISAEIEWSSELRANRAIADGVWGAATIQPTGVLKVAVNGL